MEDQQNRTVRAAWETFSQTGRVGAYLAYRAILAEEKRGGELPSRR